MDITRAAFLPDIARQIDFSFEVDAEIEAPFDAHPFAIRPLPPRRKSYVIDEALFAPHDAADAALFLAHSGDALAGYVALDRHWTGCAEVHDLAIVHAYRRRGLATALMDAAMAWARDHGFPAIRLETQSTNVAACRLYRRQGFVLGGYDRLLYRELPGAHADGAALFWYRSLRGGADGRMIAGLS